MLFPLVCFLFFKRVCSVAHTTRNKHKPFGVLLPFPTSPPLLPLPQLFEEGECQDALGATQTPLQAEQTMQWERVPVKTHPWGLLWLPAAGQGERPGTPGGSIPTRPSSVLGRNSLWLIHSFSSSSHNIP